MEEGREEGGGEEGGVKPPLPGFEFADFVEAKAEALLEALVGGFVVGAAGKIVREAGHVGDFVFGVVGVLVVFAIADVFHEAGDGVAEMEGDGIGFGFVDVFEDVAVGNVDGVGFGREGEVDGGLGEGEMALGSAEEIKGFFRREGNGEGAGFGEADVFAGHAHHAASEIQGVFAGFEHAGEPIESGVGVGIADGFVEGGDEVEVLFAGFVVAEESALKDGFEEVPGDWNGPGGVRFRAFGAELEGVVGGASVAVGERGDAEEHVVGDGDFFVDEAAFLLGQGAPEEFDKLRGGVGFEDVDLGAGEKRRDHFERGIFGGGADKEDVAGFDVGKEGILLGLVEAVDFVDEDDGALAGPGFALGIGHDFLDFLDAGGDGAERDEFGFGEAGDEAREGGFAAAGRPPEEHGCEIVGFDLDAEGFAGAEEFFLADEFVEGAGAHAFGERLEGRGGFGLGEGAEEAHLQFSLWVLAREIEFSCFRTRVPWREGAMGVNWGR